MEKKNVPDFRQGGRCGAPQLAANLYLPETQGSGTRAGGAGAPQLAGTRLTLVPAPNVIVKGQWVSYSLEVSLQRRTPLVIATAENKHTATLLYT